MFTLSRPMSFSLKRPSASGGIVPIKVGFVSSRFRTPTTTAAIAAGAEASAHKIKWVSPPKRVRNLRCAYASHYTANSATASEFAAPSPFTIDGHSIQRLDTNVFEVGKFGGVQAKLLDPAVNDIGVLGDPIMSDWIPANTPMAVVTTLMFAAGATGIACVTGRTGTGEGADGSANSMAAGRLGNFNNFGTAGRIGGNLYGPSFIIGEYEDGTTGIVWGVGDSILWGKNEAIKLATVEGAMGYVDRGLNDTTRSRRIVSANFGAPGTSPAEKQSFAGWSRQLSLLRMCPERPYDTIVSEHNNNSLGGAYADFKAMMITYFAFLKQESRYWGGRAAKLYQTRPLPRPGSSDWVTTLANQTPANTGQQIGSARFQFDDDLVAKAFVDVDGYINTTAARYDQGANRDKWKVDPFATTLAADYTSNSYTMVLNAAVSPGDNIVVGPGSQNFATHVDTVVDNGTGTWTCTVIASRAGTIAAGVTVRRSYAGDAEGLHPATPGMKLVAEDVIDWKIATFGP